MTRINIEMLRKDIEERADAYQYERAERLGLSTIALYFVLKRLRL